MSSTAKFDIGSKVRLTVEGRTRLGVVNEVVEGAKRGARRLYQVRAQNGSRLFGYYRSDQLGSR